MLFVVWQVNVSVMVLVQHFLAPQGVHVSTLDHWNGSLTQTEVRITMYI